ncbi:hypothetical protein MMC28_010305 [Mycoblastus sanguinarius]|nr:hypothetical protein [Mycoblastus sanguinarius]
MPSKSTTPKHGFEKAFERQHSSYSGNQYQPPYPLTLTMTQTHTGSGNSNSKSTSTRQLDTSGTTRPLQGEPSAKSGSYEPVHRAWGSSPQGSKHQSSAGYSPVSKWEHESPQDGPWDPVGAVGNEATAGHRSGGSAHFENRKAGKDSILATKGSSASGR